MSIFWLCALVAAPGFAVNALRRRRWTEAGARADSEPETQFLIRVLRAVQAVGFVTWVFLFIL